MKKLLILCALLMAWGATAAHASDADDDYLVPPASWGEESRHDNGRLVLASNDRAMSSMSSGQEQQDHDRFVFKERRFTSSKIHQYLGIGSLAAAGGTLLAPKEEDGLHENLGKTAAALGAAAVVTGFIFHWDDFNLGNGFRDPDNLHMILTTLGTAGYLAAVDKAPEGGHGGTGAFGAISMAIGIKMTW